MKRTRAAPERIQRGLIDIDAECLFVADALGLAVGKDGAIVYSPCQFPVSFGRRAELSFEFITIEAAYIPNHPNTQSMKTLVRHRPHTRVDVRATDTKALRDHGTKFRIAPDDVCRVYLNKKRFV